MRSKRFLAMVGAASLMMSGAADAAVVNLLDWGGVKGSAAEQGFNIAAGYWGSVLTNNTTINLGVSFSSLGGNTVGNTESYRTEYSVRDWENNLLATRSNSTIDQNIVLPTLNGDGNISFITNGTTNGTDDTSKLVYNQGSSYSSHMLYINNAVAKAIDGNGGDPNGVDGHVTFSSDFKFDFDPTDGIAAGTFDFLTVAIHEIGHALGFISGTDYLDYYGAPNGPGRGQYDDNASANYTALDMFRYSNDPAGLVPGDDNVLDLSVGTASFFSVDGGKTALFDNKFATGAFNGDGDSGSHWKHSGPCNALGIMDPIVCYGHVGEVSALDLAAFDAMGWNLNMDVATNPDYRISTAQIFRNATAAATPLNGAVPEPATWLTMILGFGVIGAALRRRTRTPVRVAA